MTRLLNKLTGTEMWVADDRLNEYLGAGHKPVPVPETAKPAEPERPVEVEVSRPETVKPGRAVKRKK